eukprot:gene23564-29790_t
MLSELPLGVDTTVRLLYLEERNHIDHLISTFVQTILSPFHAADWPAHNPPQWAPDCTAQLLSALFKTLHSAIRQAVTLAHKSTVCKTQYTTSYSTIHPSVRTSLMSPVHAALAPSVLPTTSKAVFS